jgi:hypothetical protein
MDLSIIIVNFNTKELLNRCVESIAKSKTELTYEIVIVDNNSSYDVKNQIKELGSRFSTIPIILLDNEKNVGFGKANNQGAGKAKGDYVLFLNTDAFVYPDTIHILYKELCGKAQILAGPKLLNKDETIQYSCGPYFSLPVVFAMLFLKGDVFGITRYSPKHNRFVDWVSGACFMIRREKFLEEKGFDENMFMYMEEVEFMDRWKKQGGKILFVSNAKCVHIGSASSGDRKSPILNIYRGLSYLYEKNHRKYQIQILKCMLYVKALVSYIIGRVTGNKYLVSTYKEAMDIV